MTTKFNQDMYAKMRSKKNKPLSNLGKRIVRIMEKGVSVTPATLGTEMMRTASSAASIEEITLIRKKPRVADKGKEKADSHSSNVWDDVGIAQARAQEVFTTEELKVLSSTPSNEVVGRHIHKLVQVLYLYNFTIFFSFLHHPENFTFLFRYWGRAFISLQSTLLKRQRLRLCCQGWRLWRQRTPN